MIDTLFYIFTFLMLSSALCMVFNPNAVNSAMFMIVVLVATAGLFVLLEAYFLAILQVLVYAGAVMVLFLFIIMLLDVDKGDDLRLGRRKLSLLARFLGVCLVTFLIFNSFSEVNLPSPDLGTIGEYPGIESGIDFSTSAKSFGLILFTKYMLPFQIIGFLLLIAMIGVIVISKKQKTAE